MPNVFSTLKRPLARVQLRTLLASRRNRHSIASVQAPAAGDVGFDGSAAILATRPKTGTLSGKGTFDLQASGTARSITKDVVLLGLDALAQSADAFPPLKSAVCGLLFLTTHIEVRLRLLLLRCLFLIGDCSWSLATRSRSWMSMPRSMRSLRLLYARYRMRRNFRLRMRLLSGPWSSASAYLLNFRPD